MKRILLAVVTAALLMGSDAFARTERSEAAKNDFKRTHPCPSTGERRGPCPGYIIDHIKALACGGADDPSNMQWQTEAESKEKDKWERDGCDTPGGGSASNTTHQGGASAGGPYYTGPRGGCFTYSASGRKRYVSHDHCGR